MTPAFWQLAATIHAASIDLLNRHLAAAVIRQDRMQQSTRHVRWRDSITFAKLCDRVARLMEGCAMVMATRVANLGGLPQ